MRHESSGSWHVEVALQRNICSLVLQKDQNGRQAVGASGLLWRATSGIKHLSEARNPQHLESTAFGAFECLSHLFISLHLVWVEVPSC